MQNLFISTKSKSEKEEHIASLLREVVSVYNPPIFTGDIVVEQGSIPHSHPIVTLNTRSSDPRKLLEVFVHEQFHWFATKASGYSAGIEHLRGLYADNGECNVSGENPNSFWEHLIVCWNTRNFLQGTLSAENVEWVYEQWNPYPKTEMLVLQEFDRLKDILEPFGLVHESRMSA